jgi:formylglycine-generating enzyme required for sulfatase activity
MRTIVQTTAALVVFVFLACLGANAQSPVPELPKFVDNSIGMRLVLIVPGQVPGDQVGPVVTVGRPFYIGIHEVTHGQFQALVRDMTAGKADDASLVPERSVDPDEPLLGAPGLYGSSPQHPAQFVSWSRARAFTTWLSGRERRSYRLPTEAEWEYACRAGATIPAGGDPTAISQVANVADRAFQQKYPLLTRIVPVDDGHAFAAPVGSFDPNRFGIHDLIGNMWEWVGPESTVTRVVDPRIHTARGGGFAIGPERADCGARLEAPATYRYATTGFRVVLDPT